KTRDGRTTTLGRNGSDYTATLTAWALGAAEVGVFTDVSGVMTADPDLVEDAYPLVRMTYLEALELANFGASMFHPRTMIPLIQSGIPMRIRSTLRSEEPGTRIDAGGDQDETRPTCVTSLENLALLGLQWRALTRPAHVAERVHGALADAGLTVWMENQAAHGQSIGVVVPAAQGPRAVEVLERALEGELRRGELEPIHVVAPVTLLTLVGEAMGRTPGVAGRFFSALGGIGVNILASVQGASSRSVSAVVNAADTAVAVRTVHAAFNLAHQQVSVLLLGKGTVGAALLSQIQAQQEFLVREHDVHLRVVGIVGTDRHVFDERGVPPAQWRERLEASPASDAAFDLTPLLERLERLPVPVLVDCTAAPGMEAVYRNAFRRGIHVVAANKKPLTVPWGQRQALMESARRHHRAYHYETTVGASLPVIETLKNLVRTGDRVRLVEGSFSGTLGYLANELMKGMAISAAVRKAKDLGYTEPNPQDDLSGLDVARKALILARELGYELELDNVEVEPLVPAELLVPTPVEEFLSRLESFDPVMSERIGAMRSEGRTLRYLARLEPGDGCKVRVGPTGIPAEHPAVRLRGSEAFIAFTTDRYEAYPLIVQGAGAGGAVTAAGVLADILRISQDLRGR
ncbi:MAG: bifunctional aspartate kinase/homoserine dehydrogenase I, partial [Deltaproteobacteria bacterium]|nr:bifunctional aspartate kinase/homoserine dehydrogenase I [Deltaproteobacteria bacterium]